MKFMRKLNFIFPDKNKDGFVVQYNAMMHKLCLFSKNKQSKLLKKCRIKINAQTNTKLQAIHNLTPACQAINFSKNK